VPTIAETGLPGYEYVAWFGVFAPGTTRPELVARIGALLRKAIDSADTRDRLRIQGVEPQIQEPDQFREKVRLEIARWAPVIEKSGIKGSPPRECRRSMNLHCSACWSVRRGGGLRRLAKPEARSTEKTSRQRSL
jgi:hypothetical protein